MKNDDYLRSTCDLIGQIESRYMELASRLKKIQIERLWQDSYSSFNEFLNHAKINHSIASKLTQIYEVFVIEGKQKQEDIAQIGYTNLYSAIPLIKKEGMEKTMAMLTTLTRSEILAERNNQDDCEHAERIVICGKCKKRIA